MDRRFIKYIMAALLSLLMVAPTVESAHADALCDSTCIYNQMVGAGLPADASGVPTYNTDHSVLHYIGPNGIEIRYGRDATWKEVSREFGIASGVVGVLSGAGLLEIDVAVLASLPYKSVLTAWAATQLGCAVADCNISAIAQSALQHDMCMGVTIPPGSVFAFVSRELQFAATLNFQAITSPATPQDMRTWFEPCSNERASGLADTISPSLIMASQYLQPATAAQTIPASNATQMLIAADSSIYAKNSVGNGGWTQEVGPGNASAIAVGGNTQMFIRGDSAVFAKSSIGNGGWVQETDPGTANLIAASSTGVQMMRTGDNAIYAKNTIGNGGWTQEAGPGNAAAIAVGGNTQMFIRGDSAVFAKSSIGNGGWVQETDPGNATAIAVSNTGVQMFIRGDGAVFAKNGIGNGGWVQETTPGNAAAIAVGGNTQMFIRGDSAVFTTNTIGGAWVQETDGGNATAIAAGTNGTQLFKRGDSAVFATDAIGAWVQETDPATASRIAVG
ncbi:hypothetical protein [Streptomyces sp. RKAG293]|uniref:hypothetical protein n=1 Tax=Streptomyces sp. RKAG293 TaxID=2893403 RepID=UPI00203323BE|nr:hypothetical protein [Streptomyces sp. RKAG293]MCM2417657.1 hypothetical protein [Streptomyces sp. RKAG293]